MYRNFKTTMAVLSFDCACWLGATAHADCGDSNKFSARLHRQSWGGEALARPYLPPVDNGDPIVGLWHVTLTPQGNEVPPSDGTPIDNAFVTWHSDGTELMNSARPPQDEDFCRAFG